MRHGGAYGGGHCVLLWASSEDPIPVGWLAFFIGLLVIVIIGIILALAGRIKEIKGGEQDEASKY